MRRQPKARSTKQAARVDRFHVLSAKTVSTFRGEADVQLGTDMKAHRQVPPHAELLHVFALQMRPCSRPDSGRLCQGPTGFLFLCIPQACTSKAAVPSVLHGAACGRSMVLSRLKCSHLRCNLLGSGSMPKTSCISISINIKQLPAPSGCI